MIPSPKLQEALILALRDSTLYPEFLSTFGETSGSAILIGTGNPSNTLGGDGDFYIDESSGEYYLKVSGVWSSEGNLTGPAGPTGAAGADGADGATGSQGPVGSQILTGSGTPSNTLGVNNDFYLNSVNGVYYKKLSGSWQIEGSLKGPNGPTGLQGIQGPQGPPGTGGGGSGSQILVGTTVPSNGLGADGDFYLRSTNGDYYKKVSGSWGSPLGNLTGPAGATGSQGAQGIQGIPGTNGNDGAQGPQGIPGVPGADGAAGTNGTNGADGATGSQGPAGTNGTNGTNGSDGATGPQGSQGIQGVPGTNGTNGTNGSNGSNGATWYTGVGAPSNILGVDNDLYLNTFDGDISKKVSGAWGVIENIIGPQGMQGIQGPQGLQGIQGVPGTNGTNGTNGSNGATGATGPSGVIAATAPVHYDAPSQTVSMPAASTTQNGYMSSALVNILNAKQDASNGNNYAQNQSIEVDASSYNLYDNSGRTVPAYLLNQDLTFTSTLSGNSGNGVNIEYIYNASFASGTPNINVISASHVQVQWNNGPTVSNNPTATQLKAAWDAVPAALAIATVAITGTAGKLQYITGSSFLGNGGDTAPVDGTTGSPTGLTVSRTTSSPLVGTGSLLIAKDGNSRQGTGVSTDLKTLNAADLGTQLQINFFYNASSGMVLGSSSDVKLFLLDVTNNAMLPITAKNYLVGPTGNTIKFVGLFTSVQTSTQYRLIFHVSTTNATAWNLEIDELVINNSISAVAATQVPAVVASNQPVSGLVTDRMAVCWLDGATQWTPLAYNVADTLAQLGFCKGTPSGGFADIQVSGLMDGFSFGPFAGYNQYVDNLNPGGLTPLPAPFTDTYIIMGKGVSATQIIIKPFINRDFITSKGGLLTNAGANNGTGDQVLAVGANGSVPVANSAVTLGIQWAAAIVNGGGFAYTLATRTLVGTLAGDVTGTLTATVIAAATVTGKAITGFVSGAGTVAATDTILQAINKIVGNIALKAPLATPVFTGDVNSSTGNVLISTLGKGLQVKTGVNSKIGQATLVAGTVTVANTSVTANSRIFLTVSTAGGTQGFLKTAKVAGTSFTITSTSATETSIVDWYIVESIP